MKHSLPALGALVAAVFLANNLCAQVPIGSYTSPVVSPRPTISPYVNLNRGIQNPAINYFGIVRPQIDNHQAIQSLQQQVLTTQGLVQTQPQAGALSADEMAPTGRALGGYLNYSHYYPLYGRTAGGITAPGAVRR
jgi:hypothetical protein